MVIIIFSVCVVLRERGKNALFYVMSLLCDWTGMVCVRFFF